MTDHKHDGGPAFPAETASRFYLGMSLRDWFAANADQPGAAEICSEAGLVYSEAGVWSDGKTRIGSFVDWWREKSNDERFRLVAAVRYRYADAMLAERAKK